MSKYIKSFENASDMQNYIETAPGKAYYLLKDNSGEEGIGTTLNSGKKIISYYKPQHDYLTFTAVDAGATVTYNATANTTAEYSTDGGNTWTDAVGVTVTLTNVGDKVKYRGVISGNISKWGANRFAITNKRVKVSGSIMSMHNNNPDDMTLLYDYEMGSLFVHHNTSSTPNLSYYDFEDVELPATTLSSGCYYGLFKGSNLTKTHELPATSLSPNCYEEMYSECVSLIDAYDISFITPASSACKKMFYGCSSLTTAPEIHISGKWGEVTTTSNIFSSTFEGCTSLAIAPEITNVEFGSYALKNMENMFKNCSSLTSVTHHITSWSTGNATNWLSGVAASGTVTCPAASTIPSDSVSGIPTGWTRVDL